MGKESRANKEVRFLKLTLWGLRTRQLPISPRWPTPFQDQGLAETSTVETLMTTSTRRVLFLMSQSLEGTSTCLTLTCPMPCSKRILATKLIYLKKPIKSHSCLMWLLQNQISSRSLIKTPSRSLMGIETDARCLGLESMWWRSESTSSECLRQSSLIDSLRQQLFLWLLPTLSHLHLKILHLLNSLNFLSYQIISFKLSTL